MDELKLPTQLVNALLQYLGGRPFVEVAGLIEAIHKAAKEQGAIPVSAEQPAEPVRTPETLN